MADRERWQLGGEEPQQYVRNKVPGLFLAAAVYSASDAARAALERYRDGDGYAVPTEVHFLTARA